MKINKDLIQAFLVVLLISGFALVVGNIFKESNEKELTELRKIQEAQKEEKYKSELREKAADHKRDSFKSVLDRQQIGINLLNDNFKNINSNILNMKSFYDKTFNELKNIQNEKDHITTPSIDEQSNYISKYKYKEYSGSSNP